MSLAQIIQQARDAEKQESTSNIDGDDDNGHELGHLRAEQTSKSLSRQLRSAPNTPSTRTGPPRSLSFSYSFPSSPSRHNSNPTETTIPDFLPDPEDDELVRIFSVSSNNFRSALEVQGPRDLKGKRRDSRYGHTHAFTESESWNPIRWFQDSPVEEKQNATDYNFPFVSSLTSEEKNEGSSDKPVERQNANEGQDSSVLATLTSPTTQHERKPRKQRGASFHSPISPTSPQGRLRRAFSVPHPSAEPTQQSGDTPDGVGTDKDKENTQGKDKWARLRSLLPHITHSPSHPILPGPSTLTSQAVNIIDELITGPLATLMPRLYFDRDEKGHRRVPILFHRLRIRVSDSLHPMHKSRSVFRIECEYFNGAVRWVVYRELKDFLALHGHYRVAMLQGGIGGGPGGVELPEFPTTSLPYFKFLKKEGREKGNKVGKADFARMQREQLENYLIKLIRAVMFHPSSNRLAAFLEISSLSISLAQSGGAQYKAGYLRIDASVSGTFGRKSAGWKEKKAQRWCAVRESYLVVLEEPGELAVWDVFLLDSDFKIERPKRYYRQGLGLLHHEHHDPQQAGQNGQTASGGTVSSSQPHTHIADGEAEHEKLNSTLNSIQIHLDPPDDNKSVMSSIKSKVSKIFHLDSSSSRRRGGANLNGNEKLDPSHSCNREASSSRAQGHGRSRSRSHATREGTTTDMSSIASSDSSDCSTISVERTPMLDPSTNTNPLIHPASNFGPSYGYGDHGSDDDLDDLDGSKVEAEKERERRLAKKKRKGTDKDVSKHTFYVVNSQMRLKLFARNERQMLQFVTALERTAQSSHYTGRNRFESFAPIRLNVAAQWLVDGRDYFWNLSRAILLAKESIYIHDWWLSPELLMRRPDKEKYRLDRLLERKAKEGVKIYIILYLEVSNRTTPTDSNYAKQCLSSLHPNVMVQRSPSHFQTGTFYWAHHEKMCVIDQAIAFMGGLDLCFGRWDTAQHVLTDDMLDTDKPEIWPGKDYSNPRISDFHNLNKPEEDMYDRTKVPRMPWHDVAMQIVGQPARDLARHFVQRWNHLLRIKNHSRLMPFLLPPPEFRPGELSQMGLTGTCELQICRSAGPWSMGTPGKIEHSIQNAYLKAIQMSEHFVYIENQFFITSTVVNDVKVENNIGDALVQRIIRAHRDKTPWKCCIMIPLLPGFTFPVDHSDASAIRIILECQNRTIARGPDSIFSRLRKEGIDPDEYISVFSLRNWAKMRGDVLTTEQVYIHGKVCIVDDRLAIIGSANINERSQRGDRDSELASVIRDTDMIDCTMAGRPFKVGRFAHTLRVRLMREHLGVDVDALDEEDLMTHEPITNEDEQEPWDPNSEQVYGQEDAVTFIKKSRQKTPMGKLVHSGMDNLHQAVHAGAETTSSGAGKGLRAIGLSRSFIAHNANDGILDAERKDFNPSGDKQTGFASSVVPTLEEKTLIEGRPHKGHSEGLHYNVQQETIREESPQANDPEPSGSTPSLRGESPQPRTEDGVLYGAPVNARQSAQVDELPPRSSVDLDNGEEKATLETRSTLRKHFSNRFGQWTVPTPRPEVDPHGLEDPISDAFWKNTWVASAVHNTEIYRKVFRAIPDDLVTTWKQYKESVAYHERLNKPARDTSEPIARIPSESEYESTTGQESMTVGDGISNYSKEAIDENPENNLNNGSSSATPAESKPRKPTKGVEPFERWERDEMERLLGELNGHLVIYPNRFLEGEDIANNFLFNADRLLPLPIYN